LFPFFYGKTGSNKTLVSCLCFVDINDWCILFFKKKIMFFFFLSYCLNYGAGCWESLLVSVATMECNYFEF
jgi:hypothetical protein